MNRHLIVSAIIVFDIVALFGSDLSRAQQPERARVQRRQQAISTEQLLRRQTDGITIVPDIAYRDGHERAWKLDLVMPKERGDQPRPGIVFVQLTSQRTLRRSCSFTATPTRR